MVSRKFYFLRIFIALILSALIYVTIFSFAGWISYQNFKTISGGNDFVQNSLDEMGDAMSNFTCDNSVFLSVSDKFDEIGAGISLLEMRLGKNNLLVLEQKKRYSELEKRHFDLVEQVNNECNGEFSTILFFYSNDASATKRSDIVGLMLSTLKRREPSKIMIYSFDFNLDSPTVREMISKYSVEETPFVVVNDKVVTNSLDNIEQIEPYLT